MVVPLSPLTLDKHVSNKQYMKSPKQNNGWVLTLFFHSTSGSTCLCCFISSLFPFFFIFLQVWLWVFLVSSYWFLGWYFSNRFYVQRYSKYKENNSL
jgi:hypothetical protein